MGEWMRSIRTIGAGGFGIVELVEDDGGNQYARKTFRVNQAANADAAFVEHVQKRFNREALIQSGLNHNNIVPVIDSDINAKPPYFLMPVAAASLEQDMAQSRDLNGEFLNAIMDILAGLEEIHSLRIYHRDLKPQNVLRFDTPEGSKYSISDFGLMSVSDTQITVLTQVGMAMGSDMYTAPEIVDDLRLATPMSDIYSLGCILHGLIGSSRRIPCNEINDDTSIYAHIISVCTRKDPNRRFKSVSDLRDARQSCRNSRGI